MSHHCHTTCDSSLTDWTAPNNSNALSRDRLSQVDGVHCHAERLQHGSTFGWPRLRELVDGSDRDNNLACERAVMRRGSGELHVRAKVAVATAAPFASFARHRGIKRNQIPPGNSCAGNVCSCPSSDFVTRHLWERGGGTSQTRWRSHACVRACQVQM